jgi:hypothetical protein
MNNYLAKFSDFNKKHEKMVDKFLHPKKYHKTKKKLKVKPIIEINHAKGLSYQEFLNSKYWGDVRQKVLKRDNFQCVVCHTKKNLRIHHMEYRHHGYEHRFLNDLTTVCNDCHKIVHGII